MVQQGSLLDTSAARTERETVDLLLDRPGARIERIVSTGHSTAPGQWYDQPGDEWVALLAGRATLLWEDGARTELAPGDWLLIPAHVRHRVEATSVEPPCVWLAVHAAPVPVPPVSVERAGATGSIQERSPRVASEPGGWQTTNAENAGSGRRLGRLIAASKIVNSTLDLDRLLGLILETAAAGVGADRGTLYLVDAAGKELWSKVLQGEDMVEIRLPLGTGLAGHVAQTGESIVIPDVYQDPRFHPDVDRRTGYHTRNMLCMPLQDKDGRTIGVFQFLNKQDGCFDRDDQDFIDALSAQAAVAIEYARMAQELVRNERLSAVGRMAGSIIHDFKSPMGTVRLYAETIKTKLSDEADRELADEIVHQVDHFLSQAQDILDFTRGVSVTHFRELDLGEVIESFLHFVGKDLKRNSVQLVRDIRFRGTVRLDPGAMRRAFHNIVGNARDAMPQGGTLRVATAERDGRVSIEFTDSGTGMPEEVRRRVGEPFFSRGKKQGTGLGMAMVKKVLEDHRGAVEIESAPGAGTTVRLLLPLGGVP